MFEADRCADVLRFQRERTRWLSTGWNGGRARSPAAYLVSVPEGWNCTDVDEYVARRRNEAGFGRAGPTLLTGVDLRHARGARSGSVTAYATAGVSNPAILPMEPSGETESPETPPVGTVNLVVGTTASLVDGALAEVISVAAEAKTATLLERTGFSGTTTDAVVAACDPRGEEAVYAGSGTELGADVRACVREAVTASLAARYGDGETAMPESVADADYGTATERRAEVFEP